MQTSDSCYLTTSVTVEGFLDPPLDLCPHLLNHESNMNVHVSWQELLLLIMQ